MKGKTLHLITATVLGMAAALPAQAQTSLHPGNMQPAIPPGTAGRQGSEGPNREAGPAIHATIADIMQNPAAYAGKNVIVTSRLEQIFTPWSFKLDEQQMHAGGIDSDMLVIAKVPLKTMGVDKSWQHASVSVTGTVRILQAADFRRDYGQGADDELFRRYEGKPAIVAFSIRKAQ